MSELQPNEAFFAVLNRFMCNDTEGLSWMADHAKMIILHYRRLPNEARTPRIQSYLSAALAMRQRWDQRPQPTTARGNSSATQGTSTSTGPVHGSTSVCSALAGSNVPHTSPPGAGVDDKQRHASVKPDFCDHCIIVIRRIRHRFCSRCNQFCKNCGTVDRQVSSFQGHHVVADSDQQQHDRQTTSPDPQQAVAPSATCGPSPHNAKTDLLKHSVTAVTKDRPVSPSTAWTGLDASSFAEPSRVPESAAPISSLARSSQTPPLKRLGRYTMLECGKLSILHKSTNRPTDRQLQQAAPDRTFNSIKTHMRNYWRLEALSIKRTAERIAVHASTDLMEWLLQDLTSILAPAQRQERQRQSETEPMPREKGEDVDSDQEDSASPMAGEVDGDVPEAGAEGVDTEMRDADLDTDLCPRCGHGHSFVQRMGKGACDDCDECRLNRQQTGSDEANAGSPIMSDKRRGKQRVPPDSQQVLSSSSTQCRSGSLNNPIILEDSGVSQLPQNRACLPRCSWTSINDPSRAGPTTFQKSAAPSPETRQTPTASTQIAEQHQEQDSKRSAAIAQLRTWLKNRAANRGWPMPRPHGGGQAFVEDMLADAGPAEARDDGVPMEEDTHADADADNAETHNDAQDAEEDTQAAQTPVDITNPRRARDGRSRSPEVADRSRDARLPRTPPEKPPRD